MAQTLKMKSEEGQGGAPAQVPGLLGRVLSYPRRLQQFVHEVRVELKQVTWPTRNDVKATTMVVIVTVAFFGLYFYLLDSGLSWLVQRVFERFQQ